MIYRFSLFVAACTFVLIAAGGLVTSTESGLSVPDWPLSYGSLNPPMVGGIRYEHSHRVIAGFVGLMVLILTILVWRADSRAWMKRLAAGALLGVVLQALLGGLTVIYLLPLPVSVAHACLGQTLFALLSVLALSASPECRGARAEISANTETMRRLAAVLLSAVFIQLILGALVHHTDGDAIWWHAGGACAVFVLTATSFWFARRAFSGAVRRFAAASLHSTLLQILLGLGAYYLTIHLEAGPQPGRAEVLVATAHQAVGALVLAAAALLAAASHRFASPPELGR